MSLDNIFIERAKQYGVGQSFVPVSIAEEHVSENCGGEEVLDAQTARDYDTQDDAIAENALSDKTKSNLKKAALAVGAAAALGGVAYAGKNYLSGGKAAVSGPDLSGLTKPISVPAPVATKASGTLADLNSKLVSGGPKASGTLADLNSKLVSGGPEASGRTISGLENLTKKASTQSDRALARHKF